MRGGSGGGVARGRSALRGLEKAAVNGVRVSACSASSGVFGQYRPAARSQGGAERAHQSIAAL